MPIISGGKIIEGAGLGAPLTHPGPPTTTTFLGTATVGSRLIDTSSGLLYAATAVTASAVTWTVVGTQTAPA